jgi:hypothetical protein
MIIDLSFCEDEISLHNGREKSENILKISSQDKF